MAHRGQRRFAKRCENGHKLGKPQPGQRSECAVCDRQARRKIERKADA